MVLSRVLPSGHWLPRLRDRLYSFHPSHCPFCQTLRQVDSWIFFLTCLTQPGLCSRVVYFSEKEIGPCAPCDEKIDPLIFPHRNLFCYHHHCRACIQVTDFFVFFYCRILHFRSQDFYPYPYPYAYAYACLSALDSDSCCLGSSPAFFPFAIDASCLRPFLFHLLLRSHSVLFST